METVLIVITILSMATAVAAIFAARRVRREERRRSDARIAALSAAAGAPDAADGRWTQVAGEWQWDPAAESSLNPESLIPDTGPTRTSSERFFGTVVREDAPGGRVPLFVAAVLILMLGGALVSLHTSTESTGMPAERTAMHGVDPLELVSLGHLREANTLTISGTVRNPLSGHKLEGLTAVVSLLDSHGGLVSTKDVPLDYRALGPGEEAPFKMTVPDSNAIARYRVSFRAGTEVIPHVDRRSETKLATLRQ